MIDYAILKIIWWGLLGVLLVGFAVLDGADMGVGMLVPFLGRNDTERRIIINTVAPIWESNQVWLILGAGAIFAAWPPLYAAAFSGFYLPMFVLLAALILRPVAFKFRSKLESSTWRSAWDIGLFISGFVPALIFGVAVGNTLQGVPFYFDDSLHFHYTGHFYELLNPYALCIGCICVVMMLLQGAAFLYNKADSEIAKRCIPLIRGLSVILIASFCGVGLITHTYIEGYTIISQIEPSVAMNPLSKIVQKSMIGWSENFLTYPFLCVAPALVYLGLGGALLSLNHPKRVMVLSSLATSGFVLTIGVTLYPFLLPSSSHFNSSLTVWDACSSQRTLGIMLIAVCLFMPVILLYVSWVYRVLKGRITQQIIQENDSSY